MPILDYVLREKWGYNEEIESHLNHLEEIKLEIPSKEQCDADYYEAPLIKVCVNLLKSGIYLQPDQDIKDPVYAPKLKVGLDYLLKSIEEIPSDQKLNTKEIIEDLENFFRLKLLADNDLTCGLVLDFFKKLRKANNENPTSFKKELFCRMIVLIYETGDYYLFKYNRFRQALKFYAVIDEIPKDEITALQNESVSDDDIAVISHEDFVQISNVHLFTEQYNLLDEKIKTRQFYEAIANFRRRIQLKHLDILSDFIKTNMLKEDGAESDTQQKLLLWNLANEYFVTGKSEIKGYTKKNLSALRNEVVILNILLDHSLSTGFYLHYMVKPEDSFKFAKLLVNYPELSFFLDLKKVFYTKGRRYRILNKNLANMNYYVKLLDMCLGEFEWPQKLSYYTSYEMLENSLPVSSKASETGHFSMMHIGHTNDSTEGETIFNAISDDDVLPGFTESLEYPYVFVKSFTTRIDDLNMWEKFGDRAAGLCVMLDSKKASEYYVLKKVCYLRNDSGRYKAYMEDNESMSSSTISMINDLIYKFSEEYEAYIKRGGDKRKVVPLMQSIAYLFKTSASAHEDEYRLIRIEDVESPAIKRTSDKDGSIFVISREKALIKELIFGPKAEQINEKIPYLQYRCHFLSKELGLDKINIKGSMNEWQRLLDEGSDKGLKRRNRQQASGE